MPAISFKIPYDSNLRYLPLVYLLTEELWYRYALRRQGNRGDHFHGYVSAGAGKYDSADSGKAAAGKQILPSTIS